MSLVDGCMEQTAKVKMLGKGKSKAPTLLQPDRKFGSRECLVVIFAR